MALFPSKIQQQQDVLKKQVLEQDTFLQWLSLKQTSIDSGKIRIHGHLIQNMSDLRVEKARGIPELYDKCLHDQPQ